jgi:hypothetical protein
MRLDELVGIKKLRGETPQTVVDFIKKEFAVGRTKLRPLGKGANAVALTDGTTVFKFWAKDSMYEKYVALASANSTNPFFPKFKSGIRKLPTFISSEPELKHYGIDHIKYVKIELLQPATDEDMWLPIFIDPALDKEIEEATGRNYANGIDLETLGEWGGQFTGNPDADLKYILDDYLQDYCGYDFEYTKHMRKVNPKLVQLIKAFSKTAKLLQDVKYARFDICRNNLAKRGDQLVLLDPIVDEEDIVINDAILGLTRFDLK